MLLTIHCASCGGRLGGTKPQFPCQEWHNDKEPDYLDPAYPGPEAPKVSTADADVDNVNDSKETESSRTLLATLNTTVFPKIRNALRTIPNQNLDAAIDWLNNDRPAPESIPDADPIFSKWRPIRSCFFLELTNIPARKWIQRVAITTVNGARKEKKDIYCEEISHVDVMLRLTGEAAMFTVRDVPVQDNVPMKNIPVEGLVPLMMAEDASRKMKTKTQMQPKTRTQTKTRAQPKTKIKIQPTTPTQTQTQRKTEMKTRGEIEEDAQLAEAMRQSLGI